MADIQRSPVKVGKLSHYLQGEHIYIYAGWLFGISKWPNSMTIWPYLDLPQKHILCLLSWQLLKFKIIFQSEDETSQKNQLFASYPTNPLGKTYHGRFLHPLADPHARRRKVSEGFETKTCQGRTSVKMKNHLKFQSETEVNIGWQQTNTYINIHTHTHTLSKNMSIIHVHMCRCIQIRDIWKRSTPLVP